MDGFEIGDRVIYRHCPKGGYGYIFLIPAKVLGFGRARVKVEVQKADGSRVVRFVRPESLIREAD